MNYDFFLFVWYFAHLIVPLTFGRKYYRSKIQAKIKYFSFCLVFCSLNRTFANGKLTIQTKQ